MNSTAGFNIIGPINSLSPAGDSARTILAQLSALHFPFSYLDLRLEGEGTLPNIFSPESQWGILKEMPYSINIFLIDPEKILSLMSGHPSCINTHERTNVCLVGSGIQQIPESWIHILQKMDVVLVSNFELKTKVETFAKRTVALVHRNFYLNENGKHELDSLLANDDDPIASRTPVFLCELDAKAVSETQDPTWVLRAFKMAFPDGIGASLSIHLRGESFPTQPTPLGDLLRELARKFPSIRVLEKEDSKIATDSFLSTCDVYVALLPEKGEVNGVLHAMHGGKAVLTNRNFISGHQIHEDQAALIRTLEQGLPDLEQAADWMKRLAANPKLCQSMGRKIKDKLNVNVRPTEQQGVFQEIARIHGMRARKKNATGRPRILFQNRSSAYLNPGGDTVVMNKLQAELEVLGARVDFSPANTVDLVDYDLVHLFNATLPQVTEAFAQNAVRQRKPYVFHAFQEMFSKYTAQCVLFRRILETYIFKGQPIGMLDELMKLSSTSTIERDVTSPYAMSHASVVFACSEREAQSIQSLNPSAKVQVSTYGATVVPSKIGPELFEQQFGVRNFILCVGRLEGRKNQLMLLAALENSDLTLVFADGGFTGDGSYADLCRRFRRKGKTIFTGRLSGEMLVSAYRAARVHCLPSWYELPGLVTLEAAQYGCAVVASSWGSIRDYMGEGCIYCEPDNLNSIRNAVISSYLQGPNLHSEEIASSFNWKSMGEKIFQIYRNTIESGNQSRFNQ